MQTQENSDMSASTVETVSPSQEAGPPQLSPTKENMQENCILKISKITDMAKLPTRSTPYSAGLDLYSAYDVTVPAFGKGLIHTNLRMQFPSGCYGRIASKSKLSWFHQIDVGAGVIDADYRGDVMIVLFNYSANDFLIKAGDPVAQIICEKIIIPKIQEVNTLPSSVRGTRGFGL